MKEICKNCSHAAPTYKGAESKRHVTGGASGCLKRKEDE